MDKYTIKEVAEILEVSKSTVRRRIKSGKIKAHKEKSPYGEQYFIPADEIDQPTVENEILEFKQHNKVMKKEEIVNALVEATESRFKEQIEKATSDIINKIESQEQSINELKQTNKKLVETVEEIKKMQREKEEKNESIIIRFLKKLYY